MRRIERTSARRGAESGERRDEGKYSSRSFWREGSRESEGRGSAVAIAMAADAREWKRAPLVVMVVMSRAA